MAELKPCPFKHDPDTEPDVARDNDGGIEPGIAGGHGVLYTLCPVCSAQGPEAGTPHEARDLWNRRAPAIEKAREALREHMAVNAATMRFIIEMGLIDSFIAELKSAGVKDGFGVRGNEALALLEVE